MTPKSQIEADLIRGNEFFSDLMKAHRQRTRFGVCNGDECDGVTNCLYFILEYLQFMVENDFLTDITELLYTELILIIGVGGEIEIPPTVNAGADQSRTVGGSSVIFTAVGTPGSAPIVSYSWQQISGPAATFTGQNTSVLTVSAYSLGTAVFRVTVTDQNGNTATDSVNLNVAAAPIQIRWGAFDIEPDLATVVLPNSMNVTAGISEFTIPFGIDSNNKFIVWSQPASQADKNNWFNTVLNYGTVPDAVFKVRVIANGLDIHGTRDIFSFDSSSYNLKVSV